MPSSLSKGRTLLEATDEYFHCATGSDAGVDVGSYDCVRTTR